MQAIKDSVLSDSRGSKGFLLVVFSKGLGTGMAINQSINQSISLFCGDCLDVMKSIPDNSIDMVLCDLPYGTINCSWDSKIPLEPLWEQWLRVLSPNSSVLLFGSEPFSTKLRMSKFKYDWIWIKNRPTGFVHAKNKPLKDFEIISVFSPYPMGHKSLLGDRRMRYNPQGLEVYGKMSKSSKSKFGNIDGKRKSHKAEVVSDFTNYPRMVLSFGKDTGKSNLHPTQKPVALCEYLIKTYTDNGMTVLDNCMGSGSTGVACLNTGRKFIGIEKDKQYFEVAKERIESVQKDLEMQKHEQQEEQEQTQNDYDEQEVEFTDETIDAIGEIDAMFDQHDDVD